MNKISNNKEDYLKVIYELGGKNKIISNKSIAQSLHVSAPSVSEMINKLLKDGYVEYTSYKGVNLTPLGLEKAIQIRRKHLLWEVFLVEKLGYNWEDVHIEAEILEHVTSKKLENALDKYLNYPKFCPHGSAIVTMEEDSPENYKSLDQVTVNNIYIISKVDDSTEILLYLKDKGLNIGDKVYLSSTNIEENIINIIKDDNRIELEIGFAKHIYVKQF